MKRLGITVILCGALLVGIPAAVAEEAPPPPDGLDATLLEDGSLLITWDATSGPVEYRVYLNGESVASVGNPEFIDPDPPSVAAYQVATVSGGAESDPSDPLIVASAGADLGDVDPIPSSTFGDDLLKTDTFSRSWPPTCTLVGVSVVPHPPFVGAHVNQRCLGAWMDP